MHVRIYVCVFVHARPCVFVYAQYVYLIIYDSCYYSLPHDKYALAVMHSIFSRRLFELLITFMRIAKCFGNQSNLVMCCLFLN